MKDQPEGLRDEQVRQALLAWDIDAASLLYEPVGFGDHHWSAKGADGRRWFVTVADLRHKAYCGPDPFDGLRRAMRTAQSLREAGLPFVVAPEGEALRRLGEWYAISVFPFLDAVSGDFDQALPAERRAQVIEFLAALHQATPPASTPAPGLGLPKRAALEDALAALGSPWYGGPYAEPARELVAGRAGALRGGLERFDALVAELDGRERVVTHGEPHPGNLLWSGDQPLVVDWDTTGLAMPERDLRGAGADDDDLARYTDLTGRAPDRTALDFYGLRWDLDEISIYVEQFRSPHAQTGDTELAWTGFTGSLDHLTG
ncbi:aminoglycoside phosphotransferase family protein [Nonomuraea sp. NPDC046570]|uniref:aminoglycoside phosphotransferase family protein n=1 Tax=Nonomuraea sp. NPDC046570 TaxID=3155255 RepID=UPI0033DA9432